MKFDKEDLMEMMYSPTGVEENGFEVMRNELIDNSRWSLWYYMVFKYNGKYYSVNYSRGATESQDELPFEHDGDQIECQEVKPYFKLITEYEPV